MRPPSLMQAALSGALFAFFCAACAEPEAPPNTEPKDELELCACDETPDEGTCLENVACIDEISLLLGGCDEVLIGVRDIDGVRDAFFWRPEPARNPDCLTWRTTYWSTIGAPNDDEVPPIFYPYFTFSTNRHVLKRCDLRDVVLPPDVVHLGTDGAIYGPRKSKNIALWEEFLAEHCEFTPGEIPGIMAENEPCLSECAPGSLCPEPGYTIEQSCEPCTSSPCEGIYAAAFCTLGGQLFYDNLSEEIYHRAAVDIPAQDGLRQLMKEVAPCCAPFETTIQSETASLRFLRGVGVVYDDERRRIAAADRCATWLLKQDDLGDTLYRCDLQESEEIWSVLTLNDAGELSNADDLLEALAPYCELQSGSAQAPVERWNTCIHADEPFFQCAAEDECLTQNFSGDNNQDRIGYCARRP